MPLVPVGEVIEFFPFSIFWDEREKGCGGNGEKSTKHLSNYKFYGSFFTFIKNINAKCEVILLLMVVTYFSLTQWRRGNACVKKGK